MTARRMRHHAPLENLGCKANSSVCQNRANYKRLEVKLSVVTTFVLV